MDKKKGLGRGLESLFGMFEDSNENITNETPKNAEVQQKKSTKIRTSKGCR